MEAEIELQPGGGFLQFHSDRLELTDRNKTISADEIIAYRQQDIDTTFPYRIVAIMGSVSMIVGFALGTLPGYSLWRTLAVFLVFFVISTLPYLWKYQQHTGNMGVQLLLTDDEELLVEVDEQDYHTVLSNLDSFVADHTDSI